MERQSLHLELFGGRVAVIASDEDDAATAAALCLAEDRLREWHATLTRFDEDSELSRLNRDSRPVVPASPMILDLAGAVSWAGQLSGGLVDATQLRALERAGYAASLAPADSAALTLSGRRVALPPRRPAGPDPHRRWSRVAVDRARGVVRRPPGVRLDSGGLAKGLAADDIATRLGHLARVAVDCAGDLRLGGREAVARRILVADPVGDGHVAELDVDGRSAVATSGVTRRSWVDGERVGHHLVDPARGVPAWTGILQATAIAPTALEAEVRAKAALLAGPDHAAQHLPYGGVLVRDDGTIVAVGES